MSLPAESLGLVSDLALCTPLRSLGLACLKNGFKVRLQATIWTRALDSSPNHTGHIIHTKAKALLELPLTFTLNDENSCQKVTLW